MVRFWIGIGFLGLFGLAMLGSIVGEDMSNKERGEGFLGGLLIFALPGGLLTYYGKQHIDTKKLVTQMALEMQRKSGSVETRIIASKLGKDEIEVRKMIRMSQNEGIIPFETHIS